MTRSRGTNPPSPTLSSSSSLNPRRATAAQSPKSRDSNGNTTGRPPSIVRTGSPRGFERPCIITDATIENDDLAGRSFSHPTRQDSFEPNASRMSLFEYRKCGFQFHWENSQESYKAFGENDKWPLHHSGQLGNRQITKARIWASEIVEKQHGFSDTVADKIVKYSTAEEKRAAEKEVSNLKKIRHNHIVAFLGHYTKGKHMGILMFPVAAWDLDEFLDFYSCDERRRGMMRPWFGCLARALLFLHTRDRPIKHRDIKPANILIDRSGAVFFTDFGISKEYSSAQATFTRGDGRFTVKYASPQMVNAKMTQGVESDIFSLGCVFLEMATVMLGSELNDMYEYISGRTGLEQIEYHRDFEHFKSWAGKLQESVKDRSRLSWQAHLIEHGLPIILRMVNESCGTESKVDLRDVCRVLEPISSGICHSCDPKQAEEAVSEHRLIPERTNGFSSNPDGLLRSHGTRLPPQHTIDLPFSANQAVTSGTVLLPGPKQSHEDAIPSPAIVLQRQATDLSDYELDEGLGPSTTPFPLLQSIEENTQISSHHQKQVETFSPVTLQDTDNPIHMNASMPTASSPELLTTNELELISTEEGPLSATSHRSATGLTSMNSTNSRIRVVDNRRKRKRITSFDDAEGIPGTEILFFNSAENRWQIVPKCDMPRLREGCLWRLPRGVKVKYKCPEGYFRPWDLPASKNLKRMFSKSMLTMYIHGRMTAAQLEAFCSQESREFSTV